MPSKTKYFDIKIRVPQEIFESYRKAADESGLSLAAWARFRLAGVAKVEIWAKGAK